MRVLIIGDVHLKPQIFDAADEILSCSHNQIDQVIQMGDLVDDWDQSTNLALYEQTLNRAIEFLKAHPDSLWLMGNHDYGYIFPRMGVRESGHSSIAGPVVRPLLNQLPQQLVHVIDGCIFTHAGLTKDWVELMSRSYTVPTPETDEELISLVESVSPYELWAEYSPIWARPQLHNYQMWPAKLQVVGHTPVATSVIYRGVLSTDVFSTDRQGQPLGDKRFAILDTEKGEFELCQ